MVAPSLAFFCLLPETTLLFCFQHLKFKETNLVKLQQFNALAHLRRLEQLTVEAQGNPVVTFTLWKYYVIFRLSHFNLQKINGIEVRKGNIFSSLQVYVQVNVAKHKPCPSA